MQHQDDSLVHFNGPLTHQDRAQIYRAVEEAEGAGPFRNYPQNAGAPWVVSATKSGSITHISIWRLGAQIVFTGRSVDEVVDEIATWIDDQR